MAAADVTDPMAAAEKEAGTAKGFIAASTYKEHPVCGAKMKKRFRYLMMKTRSFRSVYLLQDFCRVD